MPQETNNSVWRRPRLNLSLIKWATTSLCCSKLFKGHNEAVISSISLLAFAAWIWRYQTYFRVCKNTLYPPPDGQTKTIKPMVLVFGFSFPVSAASKGKPVPFSLASKGKLVLVFAFSFCLGEGVGVFLPPLNTTTEQKMVDSYSVVFILHAPFCYALLSRNALREKLPLGTKSLHSKFR